MQFSRLLASIFFLFLLSACATHGPVRDWPQGIPDREYFISYWSQDAVNQSLQNQDEYLLWITRFYQGFNFVPGWLDMTEQVDERLEVEERESVNQTLFDLGGKIAAEWAKTNETRVLNTRSVAVWRDALVESLNQNDLENYLQRLQQDVDDLLSGNITNDSIYFERYYVDEFDF